MLVHSLREPVLCGSTDFRGNRQVVPDGGVELCHLGEVGAHVCVRDVQDMTDVCVQSYIQRVVPAEQGFHELPEAR